MTDPATGDHQDLDAGPFSPWLNEVLGAIRGERGSDVPCNGCTACCTSSQFIHIEPDEDDTLSCIPPELLFPAPRLPRGHVLLGYDENGHCPMLVDDHCSIYEHRPRTCRTYDCRIFPAAGLTIDESDKVLINRQARRWRFSHPTEADDHQHLAVKAAAGLLDRHPDVLSEGGGGPSGATQIAVLAIQVHDVFLESDPEPGRSAIVDPDPAVVRLELARRIRQHPAR